MQMLAVLRRRDAIRPRRCRYRRTDNGGERETERETATSIAAPAAPAAACSSAGTGCVSAATNAERRGQPCRVDGQVDAHAGRDSPEGPPCGAAFDCALAPAALERHDGFAALPCHAMRCTALRCGPGGAGAERLHGAGCTAAARCSWTRWLRNRWVGNASCCWLCCPVVVVAGWLLPGRRPQTRLAASFVRRAAPRLWFRVTTLGEHDVTGHPRVWSPRAANDVSLCDGAGEDCASYRTVFGSVRMTGK